MKTIQTPMPSQALPGINAHARRFPLAGAQSGASVIVFKSAEQVWTASLHSSSDPLSRALSPRKPYRPPHAACSP